MSLVGEPSTPVLNRFWAHAAAFGALWGTLEITVGSFLHALRVPLSGVGLAGAGAALLLAHRQVVPWRGLSLATGLVAAVCKTLSPGGVVLGPMVGIAVEALLVEGALLLAPRALPSAALAGMLSVSWAFSQKLLSQYVFYGGDVLALYLAALRRLGAWLRLDPEAGWRVLGAVAGGVLLLGAAAGLAGVWLGRACARRLAGERRGAVPSATT